MTETAPSPVLAGIRRRCPRCGQGKLYSGFLAVAPACTACGLDFSRHDSGDGPAVFVVLVLGMLVLGAALLVELAFSPPYWLHFVLWLPLTLVGVLILLPLFKSVLIALQYKHQAAQGKLDDQR
jgi:uncharacterized protein (DUF983 family)